MKTSIPISTKIRDYKGYCANPYANNLDNSDETGKVLETNYQN